MTEPARALPALRIEEVGGQALIEDSGRPGHLALGVPPSGAVDRASFAQANRLVGNDEAAAALELLLGGVTLRALRPLVVAVTGAAAAVQRDGRPAAFGSPIALGRGQLLRVGPAVGALRSYLSVRGGIVESDSTPAALGSLSTDPTSHLGPAPCRAGDELVVGKEAPDEPAVGLSVPAVTAADEAHGVWGPRQDWLIEGSADLLTRTTWRISSDADRVGVRLDGPPLTIAPGQLPSEGVVRGAVQVPPSGQPVVFGADHPTTGGYPVVGVLDPADADRLAQLPPGAPVRIRLGRAPGIG